MVRATTEAERAVVHVGVGSDLSLRHSRRGLGVELSWGVGLGVELSLVAGVGLGVELGMMGWRVGMGRWWGRTLGFGLGLEVEMELGLKVQRELAVGRDNICVGVDEG